jgi:predicted nuclease of predicted toxin-antitoxin system
VRILLDECVNPRLEQAFPGHQVVSVAKTEWRTLSDAKLIAQAQGQCDAFVTIDTGFEHEHNLKKLSFGIIIVHVVKNRMEYYRPLFHALLQAIERVKPGEVIHVPTP